MKNTISIHFVMVYLLIAIAPVSAQQLKMSFQSIIRNSANTLITNSAIGLRFSVLQGSISGTVLYAETQNASTNANGLISIIVGNGTVVSGNMNSLTWSNGPYFFKTEIDPTGGTSYTISETTEMTSVPMANEAVLSATENGQINASPYIQSLNCAAINLSSFDLDPEKPVGISIPIPYTNGNGDLYSAKIINSIGVTGLVAKINAGFLNNGNGTINLLISGTANQIGIANFYISIGGQSCTVSIPVAVELGDSYQGGIVAHIDNTGEHGFIVAKSDRRNVVYTFPWTTAAFQNIAVPSLAAMGLNDGLFNTNAIVGQAGNGDTYAAGLCVSSSAGGYSDWYLPAKSQLDLLYTNRATIEIGLLANSGSAFTNTAYWSSTEFSATDAWLKSFSDGTSNTGSKSGLWRIRPIRNF